MRIYLHLILAFIVAPKVYGQQETKFKKLPMEIQKAILEPYTGLNFYPEYFYIYDKRADGVRSIILKGMQENGSLYKHEEKKFSKDGRLLLVENKHEAYVTLKDTFIYENDLMIEKINYQKDGDRLKTEFIYNSDGRLSKMRYLKLSGDYISPPDSVMILYSGDTISLGKYLPEKEFHLTQQYEITNNIVKARVRISASVYGVERETNELTWMNEVLDKIQHRNYNREGEKTFENITDFRFSKEGYNIGYSYSYGDEGSSSSTFFKNKDGSFTHEVRNINPRIEQTSFTVYDKKGNWISGAIKNKNNFYRSREIVYY